MTGWIKLHRSLKDWEWYDDHNATRLLLHLLVSVNYEDKQWKGQTIKAGSLVTSWEVLANQVGLSIKQVRTAMSKLERSKEVTRYTTNKWQTITLIKWEKLQGFDSEHGRQTVTQRATTKEYKEEKNINERKKSFYDSLIKYVSDYPKEMIRDFYEYWVEHGENDKKLRFEKEKSFGIARRLKSWYNRNPDQYNAKSDKLVDFIKSKINKDGR